MDQCADHYPDLDCCSINLHASLSSLGSSCSSSWGCSSCHAVTLQVVFAVVFCKNKPLKQTRFVWVVSNIFFVHPWGRFPIWRSYFSKGLKHVETTNLCDSKPLDPRGGCSCTKSPGSSWTCGKDIATRSQCLVTSLDEEIHRKKVEKNLIPGYDVKKKYIKRRHLYRCKYAMCYLTCIYIYIFVLQKLFYILSYPQES